MTPAIAPRRISNAVETAGGGVGLMMTLSFFFWGFVSSLMIKMDTHLRLPNINLQEILLYLCLFAIILFYKPEEIY